jgi:hypothetical protein
MVTAFKAVDAEGQERLERDLIDLINPTTVRKTMVVQSDYVEVVATRKQTTVIRDLLAASNSSPSWRWDNIPLPEPHVAGILTSGVLHLTRPWRLSIPLTAGAEHRISAYSLGAHQLSFGTHHPEVAAGLLHKVQA